MNLSCLATPSSGRKLQRIGIRGFVTLRLRFGGTETEQTEGG